MNTPLSADTPIERILWRDGQRLTTRDLRDEQLNADRFRDLHIRFLHKTWGLVEGLAVTLSSGKVSVSPGVALDSEGALLLLPVQTIAPAPLHQAQSSTLYLVFSTGGSCGCSSSTPDLSMLCPGATNSIELEQGALSWKTVAAVVPGRDVLLARALVAAGKITSALDTSVRRVASTLRQSRLWADTTTSGKTGWSNSTTKVLHALQVTVDTSEAGFLNTPIYSARLTGGSSLAAQCITAASSTSFTFSLFFPPTASGKTPPDAAQAEADGWTLTWIAVERQR